MWPDQVLNPGPLTYKSGAPPTALHGPALSYNHVHTAHESHDLKRNLFCLLCLTMVSNNYGHRYLCKNKLSYVLHYLCILIVLKPEKNLHVVQETQYMYINLMSCYLSFNMPFTYLCSFPEFCIIALKVFLSFLLYLLKKANANSNEVFLP